MNKKLLEIFNKKPYLAWDIADKSVLSERSMLEYILNNGDWNDVMEAIDILGVKKASELFQECINKERINLRPQTVNYFKLYFDKYAQGSLK